MQAFEFDINHYVNTLIEAMGFKEQPEENSKELKENLLKQLLYRIQNTVFLNLEGEEFNNTLDTILEDKEPLMDSLKRAVETSETANKALAETLDEFFNEMVESTKILGEK